MGRDTIQLEDAVSTISQEYLLEFSSEYFIPKNLHPELPGPVDHIVDFPEGKIGVYTKKLSLQTFASPSRNFSSTSSDTTKFTFRNYHNRPGKNTPQCYTKPLDSLKNWNNRFFWVDEKVFPTVVAWRMTATKDDKPQANTYSIVDVATLDTHPTASRVIQIEDAAELSTSSGIPSTVERSLLDFSNKDAPLPPPVTQGIDTGVHSSAATKQEILVTDDAGATEATVEPNLEKEMISMGLTIRKRRRQRDAGEEGSKAPAKMLRKDHDAARAEHCTRGGKSLARMSVDTGLAIHAQKTQEPPMRRKLSTTQIRFRMLNRGPSKMSHNAVNLISSFRGCRSSKEKGIAGDQDSKISTPSPPITGSPGIIYQPGWGVPNSCRLDTLEACQDVVDHIAPLGYFSELRHLPNDEFLSQYNINLARQVAMGSQLRLRFEQEAKLLKKSVAQVARRDQRIATREKHIKDLEAQLEVEINMKKATEVKNSEVTKELEDLRMRFSGLEVGNAQLSQQVIGHGLRLAVMKCAESTELRQAFANVVSAGIAKCLSKGLKYGVEHGKAGLELTAVEAYDPEADNKYVAALHNMKDLSYPLIDELEQYWNPWACKDEIILGDVIAENISRVEKKKKSRVVCPDAATQTEDEESPRLLRSKSLPALFTLDLP
ncbi:hypothetical protein Tco_0114843 [Tanacetum coccineum]